MQLLRFMAPLIARLVVIDLNERTTDKVKQSDYQSVNENCQL